MAQALGAGSRRRLSRMASALLNTRTSCGNFETRIWRSRRSLFDVSSAVFVHLLMWGCLFSEHILYTTEHILSNANLALLAQPLWCLQRRILPVRGEVCLQNKFSSHHRTPSLHLISSFGDPSPQRLKMFTPPRKTPGNWFVVLFELSFNSKKNDLFRVFFGVVPRQIKHPKKVFCCRVGKREKRDLFSCQIQKKRRFPSFFRCFFPGKFNTKNTLAYTIWRVEIQTTSDARRRNTLPPRAQALSQEGPNFVYRRALFIRRGLLSYVSRLFSNVYVAGLFSRAIGLLSIGKGLFSRKETAEEQQGSVREYNVYERPLEGMYLYIYTYISIYIHVYLYIYMYIRDLW